MINNEVSNRPTYVVIHAKESDRCLFSFIREQTFNSHYRNIDFLYFISHNKLDHERFKYFRCPNPRGWLVSVFMLRWIRCLSFATNKDCLSFAVSISIWSEKNPMFRSVALKSGKLLIVSLDSHNHYIRLLTFAFYRSGAPLDLLAGTSINSRPWSMLVWI